MQMRSMLRTAVYNKVLRLDGNTNKGGVQTVMSTDVGRLCWLSWGFHNTWATPLRVLCKHSCAWWRVCECACPLMLCAIRCDPPSATQCPCG